jgi:hypothetical protein
VGAGGRYLALHGGWVRRCKDIIEAHILDFGGEDYRCSDPSAGRPGGDRRVNLQPFPSRQARFLAAFLAPKVQYFWAPTRYLRANVSRKLKCKRRKKRQASLHVNFENLDFSPPLRTTDESTTKNLEYDENLLRGRGPWHPIDAVWRLT